ncbi:hypothetical protein HLI01_22160 [Rhizobium laguerreae]|uniref:hypothetical protein n=1 Tax=Rhizobium laguerreae TaxID=1076926 RepID=UPI0014782509|nr:hypothetical protein [Rhizobium laguerreae]NNH59442.1 hypothetical protein [Rhizobium laguerreae]
MSKLTFLDWDTTANNNTDVGGISIAENCPPSNINNGMRETMAQLRSGVDGKVVYAAKSGNYTALGTDNNAVHRYTATATVSLTAAATLATNWHYTVIADGADVTIDPNGAETIDGAATLVVPNGYSALIICNGSAFFTNKLATTVKALSTSLSAYASPGHLYGLALSNSAGDLTNDIDIAAGSAASDGSTPYLMALASALTKRLDANWVVGTNQGGLDTGAVANGTYWLWIIQRSDTGVTDALFSASATAPTMPANYDRKRRIAPIIRASATNVRFSYEPNTHYWGYFAPVIDTSTIGLASALRTVRVPVGAVVMGRFGFSTANSGGPPSIVNHWDPALGSTLPDGRNGVGQVFVNTATSQAMSGSCDVCTNTSAQIYNLQSNSGGSALTSYSLVTLGYFFTPGL